MSFFISSGCSFTECWTNSITWPNHIEHVFKKHYALGHNGFGNGYISRSIICAVQKLLQTHKADEIFVGIMWSGYDRIEVHNPKFDRYNILEQQYNKVKGADWPELTNLSNMPQQVQNELLQYPVLCSGVKHYYPNMSIRNWHSLKQDRFFVDMFDEAALQIFTLEHILRTQWFLEKNKIKYFMTVYKDSVLQIENTHDTDYLLDSIDYTNFVTTQGLYDWVKKHLPNEIDNTRHPKINAHRAWAQELILPWIKKNWNII